MPIELQIGLMIWFGCGFISFLLIIGECIYDGIVTVSDVEMAFCVGMLGVVGLIMNIYMILTHFDNSVIWKRKVK